MSVFEIGDRVMALDADLSGKVIKIFGDRVAIVTHDGFEMEFRKDELLKIASDTSLKANLFAHQSVDAILTEKEQPLRKSPPKSKPKERNRTVLEVDLHIHKLTPNFRRMSNHEMLTLQLDTAKRQLEFAIRNRIQKVVFIHGVGEGVLKLELEYLLDRYDHIRYYDANYQKYGLGATEVYVMQKARI